MMWGSNYPHREATFPQSRKILAEILAHAETGKGQRMPSFRFAADSSLEQAGFEPSVPRRGQHFSRRETSSIPRYAHAIDPSADAAC
jgi:hypothetical protein